MAAYFFREKNDKVADRPQTDGILATVMTLQA